MEQVPRISVAQLGCRRHYAVPTMLHRAGMLAHLYTDAYMSGRCLRCLHALPSPLLPSSLKRLVGRCGDLPSSKVTAFTRFGLQYYWKRTKANSKSDTISVYLWASEIFNRLVIQKGLNGADAVYGFSKASALLFRYCRDSGIKCILDQCSLPTVITDEILAQERDIWPGWQRREADTKSTSFAKKEQEEWHLADIILAPSEFVRDGLLACTVPPEKCWLVPYGIDTSKFEFVPRIVSSNPLRVLFAGAVGLAKGVQYLLSAAAKLGKLVNVRLVGPIVCKRDALLHMAPANTEILGSVPRIEAGRHFEWADVFCLPSLFEGSAIAIYEALASGLPVICTFNAGSVVRDGKDGFIVPIRNSEAIAEKIELLSRERELLSEMSRNARKRAEEYSLKKYGERLISAISTCATRP